MVVVVVLEQAASTARAAGDDHRNLRTSDQIVDRRLEPAAHVGEEHAHIAVLVRDSQVVEAIAVEVAARHPVRALAGGEFGACPGKHETRR